MLSIDIPWASLGQAP